MLKIDRQAFLALAMGMHLGACYVSNPPPPPMQPQQPQGYPGPANEMAPTGEGAYAPADECVGWTPTGECNRWEPRGEAYAPAQECVGWTPTGECNQWEPRKEY